MPQDILNPKDETEASKERQVKPLKHPGGVERPQTVPTLGGAEGSGTMEGSLPASGQAVQPQQSSSDALFNNLFYGGQERMSPDRYHSISGEDIKMVHDPMEEIQNSVEAQLKGLTPETRFQSLSRSQFTPQYQQNITTDYDSIDDKVQASISKVQEQNDRIVELNRIGFNGNNLGSNGQLKSPALDTDIAGRGLSSELAKALEDRLKIDIPGFGDDKDPRFQNNEYGEYRDLIDGIFGLGQFAEDFAESKLPGWLVKPWVKARDGIREKLGIKDWVEERGQQGTQKIVQQTQPTNKVDPNANEWGDYGSGGIGAALYWSNLVPSVIAGSIYDVSDSLINIITGKNPYEGSRVLDAITKGRDWGLSNRWSEEKYLSLMEPEGLKPGQLTGNWWWDLPENVSKATGGVLDERLAHWVIQLPVAVASEIALDIPGDYLFDAGLDALRKGKKVTQLVDEPTSVLANKAKVTGEGAEAIPPFYETTIYKESPEIVEGVPVATAKETITIDVPYRQERLRGTVSLLPPAIDEIYPIPKPPDIAGTLPYYKPSNLVDVEANFTKVNPPNLDENGILTSQIRRDTLTLTEIGKNVRNPFNPKEALIPKDAFPLSENTLSVLENLEPLAMSRFGKVVDVEAMNSPQLLLPNNQVLDLPALPPSSYSNPNPVILGVKESTSIESLLAKQLDSQTSMIKAIEAGEDYRPLYEQFKKATIQVQIKKAGLLDKGQLYPTIKNELPDQLNSSSPELAQTGEIMLQADFNLANIATRREVLEAELADLAGKWKGLNDRLDILGDIGRQDVELSLRTEDWSSDDLIPEYQLDDGLTQPDLADDFFIPDDFNNTELPGELTGNAANYNFETISQRNAGDVLQSVKESMAEGFGDDDSFRLVDNYVYNYIENKIPEGDTSELHRTWKRYIDGDHLIDGEDLNGVDYLRKLREGTELTLEEQTVVDNLDKLLEVLPKVEGSNLVRGVRFRNKLNYKFAEGYPDLENLQLGQTITFPEYLSTSYGAYNNFTAGSQYILNIKSNRGSLFFNPLEEEVVLPRNSSFKVTNIEDVGDKKFVYLEDVTVDKPRLKKYSPTQRDITLGTKDYNELNKLRHYNNVNDYLQANGILGAEFVNIRRRWKDSDVIRILPDGTIEINSKVKQPLVNVPTLDSPSTNDGFRVMALREEAAKRSNRPFENRPLIIEEDWELLPASAEEADKAVEVGKSIIEGTKTKTALEVIENYNQNTLLTKLPEDNIYFDKQFIDDIGLGKHDPIILDEIAAVYAKLQRIYDNKLPPIIIKLVDEEGLNYAASEEWTNFIDDVPVISITTEYVGLPDYLGSQRAAAEISHELGHVVEDLAGYADVSEAFLYKQSGGRDLLDHDTDGYVHYDAGYNKSYSGSVFRNVDDPNSPEVTYTELVSVLNETAISYEDLNDSPEAFQQFYIGVIDKVRKSKPTEYKNIQNNTIERGVYKLQDAYATLRNKHKDITPGSASDQLRRQQIQAEDLGVSPAVGSTSGSFKIPRKHLAAPFAKPNLYHGTRLDTSIPLSTIDPIIGGSPSEFGLGIYLTDKVSTALAAARKYDTINKPPTFNITKGVPNNRIVDIRNVKNIIDLNKPLPTEVKKIFIEAALSATGNKNFATKFLNNVKKTGLAWNAFRERYFIEFGTAAPEGLVRRFQQYVSNSFKSLGVDGGRFGDTLVVYNPKLLQEGASNVLEMKNFSLESALEAQRYLDGQTYKQLEDNVSLANYLNSNKELAESLMKVTQRELTEIQGQTIDELITSLDAEDELIRGTTKEARKRIDDANTNLDNRTIEEYGMKREVMENSPCPPLPDEFYRGMK